MVYNVELTLLSAILLFFKSHVQAGFCAANDVNVIPYCTNAHAVGHTIHLDASVAVSNITACTCDVKSSGDETVYIYATTKPNGTTSNCPSVVTFNVKYSQAYFNVTCDSTQTAFVAKKDKLFFVTLLNEQIDYGTYCIRLRTGSDAITLNGSCFSSRGSSTKITINKPLTKASITTFTMETSKSTENRYSSTTGKDEEREPISRAAIIVPVCILVIGCVICVLFIIWRRIKRKEEKGQYANTYETSDRHIYDTTSSSLGNDNHAYTEMQMLSSIVDGGMKANCSCSVQISTSYYNQTDVSNLKKTFHSNEYENMKI